MSPEINAGVIYKRTASSEGLKELHRVNCISSFPQTFMAKRRILLMRVMSFEKKYERCLMMLIVHIDITSQNVIKGV